MSNGQDPFASLKKPAQVQDPFADLKMAPVGVEDPFAGLKVAPTGPPLGVIPPDVLGAISGVTPLMRPLVRVADLGREISFDDFMNDMYEQEYAPFEGNALREVGGIQKVLGIGRVGRGVKFAKDAIANAPATLVGIVEAPFLITYGAFHELMTQSSLAANAAANLTGVVTGNLAGTLATQELSQQFFRERANEVLGEMTPDEAAHARRSFAALGAMAITAPIGGIGGAALATRIGLTGIPRAAIAAQAAGAAGAVALGVFEGETPDERVEKIIGYGLLAVPLVGAHTVLSPLAKVMRGETARVGLTAAHDLAQERMVRAFDDQPRISTEPPIDRVTEIERLSAEGKYGEAARVAREAERVLETEREFGVFGESLERMTTEQLTALRESQQQRITEIQRAEQGIEARELGRAERRELGNNLQVLESVERELGRRVEGVPPITPDVTTKPTKLRVGVPRHSTPVVEDAVSIIEGGLREGSTVDVGSRLAEVDPIVFEFRTKPEGVATGRAGVPQDIRTTRVTTDIKRVLFDPDGWVDPADAMAAYSKIRAALDRTGRQDVEIVRLGYTGEDIATAGGKIEFGVPTINRLGELSTKQLWELADKVDPEAPGGMDRAIRIADELERRGELPPLQREVEPIVEERQYTPPKDDFTPENIQIAEKGPLPTNRQLTDAAVLAETFLDSDLRIASTIVHTHARLRPDDVSVIPGLESPVEAVRVATEVLPDNALIAIHKRADGTYDVAIGTTKGPLKGNVAQFQEQGFFDGQTISVDGKYYTYKTLGVDKQGNPVAFVRDPTELVAETKKPRVVMIPLDKIRRGGWQVAKADPEINIANDLKNALSPEEYQAFVNLARRIHPDGGPIEVGPVEASASSNNMTVIRDAPGRWSVIDSETGRELVIGLRNKAEAQKYINDSAQATGPEYVGREAGNVPPDVPIEPIVNAASPPPSDFGPLMQPYEIPPIGRVSQFVGWLQEALARRAPWLTDRKTVFEFLDKQHGTDLLNRVYFPLQEAALKSSAKAKSWFVRLKELEGRANKLGLTEERLELVGDWIEAMSFDELAKVHTKQEVALANKLVKLGIRPIRIFEFRRRYTEAVAAEARRQDISVTELTSKDRISIRRRLERDHKLTDSEKQAVDTFDFIVTQDMNDISLYNVVRMTNAKRSNAPSRAEFAKENELTSAELALGKEFERLYDDLAIPLDIPEWRMIRGFISHIRDFAVSQDKPGTAFLGQRASSTPGKLRDFASQYARSGEIDVYIRNPIKNLAHYIRTGFDNAELKPLWDSAREYIRGEARARRFDVGSEFYRSSMGYLSDLRGIPSEAVKNTQAFVEKTLGLLGVKRSLNWQRDVVNGILALNSSSAMAFRVGLGLRDFYDIAARGGARFKFGRFMDAIRETAPGKGVLEAYRDAGIITQQHHIEFGRPAEQTARTLGRVAEVGLKASLQPMFHEWAQAAAYFDMMRVVPEWINKVVRGKVSKQVAYEKIKVFTFDEAVIRGFDELVSKGEVELAADYLGKASAIELAGRYGLGNNPYGWRSNVGRLSTQFGTWSVYTRTYMLRNLSKGTRADRIGFAARHTMSQAALYMLGKTFGLGFGRWYTWPGLLFTGGPALQLAQYAADFGSGSPNDKARAVYEFSRLVPGFDHPGTLLVPGSYFLSDLYKAGTDKKIRDAFQMGARGIGIPITKDQPWWHDF